MDEIKKTQDEMKKLGKEVIHLKQNFEITKNILEKKIKKIG